MFYLAPMSGDIANQNYQYSLAALAGKKVEIRFVFTSDSGVTASGPVISKISVDE